MVYDEYFNNVSLLLPMNGINNGTTFTDYSLIPKEITRFGDTKTVTAQSKYYGSSVYFDGSGDYLSVPASTSFAFDTGDFTIELWAYRVGAGTGDRFLISASNGSHFLIRWSSGGALQFYINSTLVGSNYTFPFTLNTWYHFAITRIGSVVNVFIDGTIVITGVNSSSIGSTAPVLIGGYITGDYFNGYMQDLRITKGVARYTANFTPPEKFTGKLAGTVLTDTNIGADSVIIRHWSNKKHREIIIPNVATGVWESNFLSNDKYDITYLAEGCAPQIHGPYVPE